MRKSKLLKSLSMVVFACLLAPHSALTAQTTRPAFHWPEGKRVAVSLSFDDARASQVDVGVPLFDKYGAKVTFYVNPKSLEKRLPGWKSAAAKGYEIGNHSQSHPCSGNFAWSRDHSLENYTVAMMENEMDSANTDIERLLGVKPTTFAYPCGEKFIGRGVETKSYVPLVAKRFRVGRGFRDEAANSPTFCDFAQVFGVDSDGMTFEETKKAVLAAAEEGGWLVLAGHEIGNTGYQTTEAAVLEQFLKYANDPASGVWLDTLENVSKYIQARRESK
jgi:peptidoglycan/xylan/chitin deacetylase (PgdA/CDA1 family)